MITNIKSVILHSAAPRQSSQQENPSCHLLVIQHTKSSGNPKCLPSRFLTATCHPKGKASFWESPQFALSDSYESLPAGGPTDELSRQAVSSYEVAPNGKRSRRHYYPLKRMFWRERVRSFYVGPYGQGIGRIVIGHWTSPKSLPLPTPQPRGATQ